MDWGLVAGVATLITMLAFVGIVAWAYSGRRATDFEHAARLPLEEDGAP